MSIDIDHVFIVQPSDVPLPAVVRELGLKEQYRREHPGQGTRNVCFAFENLYLEFLWLFDEAEASSTIIRRTGLLERSRSRFHDVCPFGIAWRSRTAAAEQTSVSMCFDAPTWSFQPPYLPQGLSIAVATDSDDLSQPLMFRSPDRSAPSDWPVERKLSLQQEAGFGGVVRMELTLPDHVDASPALKRIADQTLLDVVAGSSYRLSLDVQRGSNGECTRLELP